MGWSKEVHSYLKKLVYPVREKIDFTEDTYVVKKLQ